MEPPMILFAHPYLPLMLIPPERIASDEKVLMEKLCIIGF